MQQRKQSQRKEKLELLILDLEYLDYLEIKESKNKNIYLMTQQLHFNLAQQQQKQLIDQEVYNEAKIICCDKKEIQKENIKFTQPPLIELNKDVQQNIAYVYQNLKYILDALVDIQEIFRHFQSQNGVHTLLLMAINHLVQRVNLAIAIFLDCEYNIQQNEFQILQNQRLEAKQIQLRTLLLPNDQKVKECINEFCYILCQKPIQKVIKPLEINNKNFNQIENTTLISINNQNSNLPEIDFNNLKKEDFEYFIQIRIKRRQETLRQNFPLHSFQSKIYNIFELKS